MLDFLEDSRNEFKEVLNDKLEKEVVGFLKFFKIFMTSKNVDCVFFRLSTFILSLQLYAFFSISNFSSSIFNVFCSFKTSSFGALLT